MRRSNKPPEHFRNVRTPPLPHGPPRSFHLRRTRPLQHRAHLKQRLHRAPPKSPTAPFPRGPRGGESHEARPRRHAPQRLRAALRAVLRREGALRAPAERHYHLHIRHAGENFCVQPRDRSLPIQGILSRSKQALVGGCSGPKPLPPAGLKRRCESLADSQFRVCDLGNTVEGVGAFSCSKQDWWLFRKELRPPRTTRAPLPPLSTRGSHPLFNNATRGCCRANSAHIRKSGPESGPGFKKGGFSLLVRQGYLDH